VTIVTSCSLLTKFNFFAVFLHHWETVQQDLTEDYSRSYIADLTSNQKRAEEQRRFSCPSWQQELPLTPEVKHTLLMLSLQCQVGHCRDIILVMPLVNRLRCKGRLQSCGRGRSSLQLVPYNHQHKILFFSVPDHICSLWTRTVCVEILGTHLMGLCLNIEVKWKTG